MEIICNDKNISLRYIAKKNGLPFSTVHGWIKKYGNVIQNPYDLSRKSLTDWTLEERFNILVEIAGLTEEARGIYCRKKNLSVSIR